jgi:hypothetical protein
MAIKYRPIPNATESTLVLNSLQSYESGFYRCVISNDCGTVTTTAAELAILDPEDYGVIYVNTFADLFDVCGITNAMTIVLLPATYTMTADLTIPSNKDITVLTGADIVTTGWTLIFNKQPHIGLYQVFSGSGSVEFGISASTYPEWWGAKADAVKTTCTSVTDSTSALEKSIAALTVGGEVVLSGLYGIYGHDNTTFFKGITLPTAITNVTIRGLNNYSSGVIQTNTDIGGSTFVSESFNAGDGAFTIGYRFTNLYLEANPASTHWNMASATSNPFSIHKFQNLQIDNCVMINFSGIGALYGALSTDNSECSTDLIFINNIVRGLDVIPMAGITFRNIDGYKINDNLFEGQAQFISHEGNVSVSGNKYANGYICRNHMLNGAAATMLEIIHGGDGGNGFCGWALTPGVNNSAYNIYFCDNIIYNCTISGPDTSAPIVMSTATQGGIYNIVVSGNIIMGITPGAGNPGDWFIQVRNCDSCIITKNVIKNPLVDITGTAGGIYPIYLYEAINCIVSDNIVEGAWWSSGINEYGTGELNNLFVNNHYTDMSTYVNVAVTKSLLIGYNKTVERYDFVVGSAAMRLYSDTGNVLLVNGASQLYVTADGILTNKVAEIQPQATEPSTKNIGMIACANRAGWDPLSKGSGGSYFVWYNGSAWVALDSQ